MSKASSKFIPTQFMFQQPNQVKSPIKVLSVAANKRLKQWRDQDKDYDYQVGSNPKYD